MADGVAGQGKNRADDRAASRDEDPRQAEGSAPRGADASADDCAPDALSDAPSNVPSDAPSKAPSDAPSDAPAGLSPELVARLEQLNVRVGAADLESGPAARPRPVHVKPIEAAVPGTSVCNEHGTCYISTVRKGVDDVHGGERMADALGMSMAVFDEIGGTAGAVLDPGATAFLDTETTGLAGGTGTYAFLIGVGRFVDGGMQVRQFFMRDPSEEAAQLAEVANFVDDCTGLVTFNGRTFDMPLLSTRYAMNRLAEPLRAAAHVDLLPVSRRIWRRRLESCKLTTLEERLLGFEREDDVPGWLIPERYLRYQRDGDARPLESVFRHNVFDILSMVSLLTRLARIGTAPEQTLHHGQDWLSLACVQEARRDWPAVIDSCEGALRRDLPPHEKDEALRRLSLAHKRRGDWTRAVSIWLDLAGDDRPRQLFPFEELAKYYEHRVRPLALSEALAVSERARVLVDDGSIRPRRGRRHALADLDHRIDRLRRRLRRASQ